MLEVSNPQYRKKNRNIGSQYVTSKIYEHYNLATCGNHYIDKDIIIISVRA